MRRSFSKVKSDKVLSAPFSQIVDFWDSNVLCYKKTTGFEVFQRDIPGLHDCSKKGRFTKFQSEYPEQVRKMDQIIHFTHNFVTVQIGSELIRQTGGNSDS